MKSVAAKLLFCLCFMLSLRSINAQYAIVTTTSDTLGYDNRVLTKDLDSISISQSGYATLQPGGNLISPGGLFQTDYISGLNLFRQHTPSFNQLKNYYVGLPHLGFYYSFASRGLQNVHVDYQHTIAKKFNIHLVYNGHHLSEQAGFLRNSGYKNNVIQLLMNYNGERYKGLYYLNYYFGQRRSSQGVENNSLLNDYPVQLIPVINQTASSKLTTVDAGTQHLLSFTKDSLVKHGIIYQNELKLQSRKYTETGETILNYDSVYKDQDSTYDHYQWYRVRNEGGYYIQSSRLSIAAKAFHQFWNYKNQGIFMDTTEIGLDADLKFSWSKFDLKSQFEFTFIGAAGEVLSNSTLNWKDRKFDIGAHLLFENRYPSVFMRNYSGNSVKWYLTDLQLQQTLKIGGYFNWKESFPFQANVSWANLSNQYWLVDNQLRNDTLSNVSLLNINIKTKVKAGHFHFDPYLALNVTSGNIRFVPLLDARLNVYWNKLLFSTKKFDFIFGATARYQTAYDLISYNHLVDLYQFAEGTLSYQPVVRVDIYTGFQIDNFRVFLRYENLDTFWNSRENFTVEGYPVAPGVIRVGITWDFFN
ncbi:MAG: hypothetical protein J0G96_03455 [Flavobacteriia bacterium]|nr:hypothetical protein [Flavobacteriia bacterium]